MKRMIIISIAFLYVFLTSCEKSDDSDNPEIKTLPISLSGTTLIASGIKLISRGVPSVKTIGLCWNKAGSPTINDNSVNIEENTIDYPDDQIPGKITGLELGTKYYIRAFADNGISVVYGEEVSTTTADAYYSETGTIIDPRDSKQYGWVKIGNQTWFSENLTYDEIPNSGTELYPYPYYGELYTFGSFDVLCPDGWHVPTYDEWKKLIDYVGGEKVAGGILKTEGITDWLSPNTRGTNKAKFSALPKGSVFEKVPPLEYTGLSEEAIFWASASLTERGGSITIRFDSEEIPLRKNDQFLDSVWSSFACRCIKD